MIYIVVEKRKEPYSNCGTPGSAQERAEIIHTCMLSGLKGWEKRISPEKGVPYCREKI
jgi:hypothetical protein